MDSDEGDDWFYESIRRYKLLQMFEMENEPKFIIQTGTSTVLIVCQNESKQKHELIEMEIPRKLTKSAENEGLCKTKDFKIISGRCASHFIYQIDCIKTSQHTLTSEYGVNGLCLYNLATNDNGLARQDKLDFMIESPNFSCMTQQPVVIASKTIIDPFIIFDLEKKMVCHKQEIMSLFPCSDQHENTIKSTCADNSIVLLNSNNGDIVFFDHRSKISTYLPSKQFDRKWTVAPAVKGNKLIYLLSEEGHFVVYDERMLANTYVNKKMCSLGSNFNVKVSPDCPDIVSISGFDPFLYIYDIRKTSDSDSSLKLVFKHDAHLRTQDFVNRGVGCNQVINHIWLSCIGNNHNPIISFSMNKSLNCWEPNLLS